MAVSPSATAQSSSCSDVDGIAFDPEQNTAESLALQACDDNDSLREVFCAYACLEKLIVPSQVSDTEELNPTRSELSALVRVINEELSRRIESADKTAQAMRAMLVSCPIAPGPPSPSA